MKKEKQNRKVSHTGNNNQIHITFFKTKDFARRQWNNKLRDPQKERSSNIKTCNEHVRS